MSGNIAEFTAFFRGQETAFVETLTEAVTTMVHGYYATAPREQVQTGARRIFSGWLQTFETGVPDTALATTKQLARQRVAENVLPTDILNAVDCLRRTLWGILRAYHTARQSVDLDLIELIEGWMHAERNVVLDCYAEILQQTKGQLAGREKLLAEQTKLIQELSTPIVPIVSGVLILPMVGSLDTHRAEQIMEAALTQIQTSRADVLILDVTGVPTIDTNVAHHLIRLARAVELLGAKVILVGVRPEIARTVVQMGINLGTITTLANLQSAIPYALAQRGLRIAKM